MRSLRHIVKTQTPSEAQKNYGNYRKLHYWAHGLKFTIENPRGSVRSGIDKNGKEWSNTLTSDYGYVNRTSHQTSDSDNLDVFLSPSFRSAKVVHVIDQIDPTTGLFDEHKVMIGWDSQEEAKRAYLSNYDRGWKGLGDMTTMSMNSFKLWLKSEKKLDTAGYVVKKAFAIHSKGYANHILKTASDSKTDHLVNPMKIGRWLRSLSRDFLRTEHTSTIVEQPVAPTPAEIQWSKPNPSGFTAPTNLPKVTK